MIRAIISDVDGTLVQTEKLKARSYAIASQRLLDLPEPDARAVEVYREVVGASRGVASRHVMLALGLEDRLRLLMTECGVSAPEEVAEVVRRRIEEHERGGHPSPDEGGT